MNYIKEINAFYDLMEREPLSSSAAILWHTLLHINNKAAWVEEFTVAGTVLKWKSGLTDSSFKRARKELEERGLIECRSIGSNVPPIYRMKRLYKQNSMVLESMLDSVEKDVKQELDYNMNQQTDLQMNLQAEEQANQHTAPTNKQKEIKQNKIKHTSDAIRFYQENFGAVSPFLAEELLSWINDFGDDFVIEAMKRSLERGKFNFGYVKGILKSWVKQGIRTVETLRERESRNGRFTGNGKNHTSTRSGEVVPDWFMERKQKCKEQQEDLKEEEDVETSELLKEYLASRVV